MHMKIRKKIKKTRYKKSKFNLNKKPFRDQNQLLKT